MALELSSRYKQIVASGKFQSLASQDPWPHYVLDELIPHASFKTVQQRLLGENLEFEFADEHPARLQLCFGTRSIE